MKNQFKTPTQQRSPQLMQIHSAQPFLIGGSIPHMETFKTITDSIMKLGELEHSSDWDPFLRITLMGGTTKETFTGYTDITIKKDKVGLHLSPTDTYDEAKPKLTWVPIATIYSIQVQQP